ncbi:MAG: ATP-binding cassette domain-containing protein, partial [Betaproteobacteria bacterium]|nr:ATP-binding cassette domain-containing protein [Betaproteobacteria bacterium]
MKKVSVQCRNIRLAYGNTEVLKNVNLEIQAGEFFALLGPSGSGKSTLLRLIAGFNKHQSGALLVDGHDIGQQEPWDRNIGMVFQSYALWPHLSVWDNVAFGLRVRPKRTRPTEAAIHKKVHELLNLVQLDWLGDRYPSQLSGGQRQRIALARALA